MDRTTIVATAPRAVLLALALAIATAGAATAQGVASLASPSPSPAADGAATNPSPPEDPMDAALDYAACMREHGVDMPDPQVGPDGGVAMILVTGPEDSGEAVDPEVLRAADEACRDLLGALEEPEVDPEQGAELAEGMLAYVECMREHGVDMADPQFSADGGFSIGFEAGEGPDPFSPEFQAAEEACRDVNPVPIGGAFSRTTP